jgi:hypothetical protein
MFIQALLIFLSKMNYNVVLFYNELQTVQLRENYMLEKSALSQQIEILRNYDNSLNYAIQVFENNKDYFQKQKMNDEFFEAALKEHERKKEMEQAIRLQLEEMIKEEQQRKDAIERDIEKQKQAATQMIQEHEKQMEENMRSLLDDSGGSLQGILAQLDALIEQLHTLLHQIQAHILEVEVEHTKAKEELSLACQDLLSDVLVNHAAVVPSSGVVVPSSGDTSITRFVDDLVGHFESAMRAPELLNKQEFVKVAMSSYASGLSHMDVDNMNRIFDLFQGSEKIQEKMNRKQSIGQRRHDLYRDQEAVQQTISITKNQEHRLKKVDRSEHNKSKLKEVVDDSCQFVKSAETFMDRLSHNISCLMQVDHSQHPSIKF